MAESSFFKCVRKVFGPLAIIIPFLALSGCGEGDGPTSIANTAIPPLDPPPVGFCDPINFELECPNRIASLEEFEGGPITILPNEKVDANNDSAMVARMQKFRAESGATFGGGTLNLTIPFEVASGDVFTMNVWSPRPVPMRFEAGIAAVDVNHGGTGWEVLTLNLGGAAGRVSSISIKFDDGTNGDAGIDPDNWTFYFDDIALVTPSDPVVPIDPEVSLYDPPEAPDLDAEVTGFDSQSVINDMFADDSTYSPVLAVSSGVGYGANVAQIGFIGFAAGFATDYESLDFKVKGMPNSVIFVKLYDGVDSLRINLTSSAYSGALTNGWYQVSIPISAFNGVSLATGIVFESDNTAPMQFTMLLNDIGFTDGDDAGGGTGTGGSVVPDASILEADGSTADLTAEFTGNGSGTGTAIVADSTYAQALEVTVADGYAPGALNLAQLFITGLSSLDSYDEFVFKVKGLTDNNLVMKIEPPAGGTAVAIDLAAPGAGITVEDLGDGWSQVVVSLAQFGDLSSANLVILQTLDNAYALGDTFLLTDIGFNTAGGGSGGSGDGAFVNGDFETGDFTGWTLGENGTITIESDTLGGRTGTFGRLRTTDAPQDVLLSQVALAEGTVVSGDSIDVSFDLYGALTGDSGVVFVEVIFLNGDGVDVGGRDFVGTDAPYTPTETWSTYSDTVIAGTDFVGVPYDVSGGVTLQLKAACGGVAGCAVDAYFDNVTFTIN